MLIMTNVHVRKVIFNHGRMDTNLEKSTEYTEETESLADVGQGSEEFVVNM
ncbi:MAG: hypothetical protein IKX30_18240 [Victivallales bacterium]|nr:hypothetical protein [Victivallales bacterium]